MSIGRFNRDGKYDDGKDIHIQARKRNAKKFGGCKRCVVLIAVEAEIPILTCINLYSLAWGECNSSFALQR